MELHRQGFYKVTGSRCVVGKGAHTDIWQQMPQMRGVVTKGGVAFRCAMTCDVNAVELVILEDKEWRQKVIEHHMQFH